MHHLRPKPKAAMSSKRRIGGPIAHAIVDLPPPVADCSGVWRFGARAGGRRLEQAPELVTPAHNRLGMRPAGVASRVRVSCTLLQPRQVGVEVLEVGPEGSVVHHGPAQPLGELTHHRHDAVEQWPANEEVLVARLRLRQLQPFQLPE
eukprot:7376386-Prymnesium_polylepis.1